MMDPFNQSTLLFSPSISSSLGGWHKCNVHKIPGSYPTNLTGFHTFILGGTLSTSVVKILIRLAYVYRRTNLERDAPGRFNGLPYTARPVFRTFQEACPALDGTGASKEKLLAMAIVLHCRIGFDSAPISSNGGSAARRSPLRSSSNRRWSRIRGTRGVFSSG
jgi:hypothetical protein